ALDIKSIKIQGASNIEKEAIKIILKYIKKKENIKETQIIELKENINLLINQRPNEPKLRNALNYILYKANMYKYENNNKKLINDIEKYETKIEEYNIKVCEIASNLIQDGTQILTHCHSSLVEKTLKIAYDKKIDFQVITTETRPRYQGRITAKNLCDYGINTTQIVDSAVGHFLKKCDYFLTGSDVIFSDGTIMNKVGTYPISIMANYFKTPHIIITTTNCCELNSLKNIKEEIEERDSNEIWNEKERPKNLKIKNPAFDIIPNELIDKIITERGVYSPESLYAWVNNLK
ncbi:translation initiation factor eIF-2B, partial [bacterium]|nr:translation initiation factor eIF-2B [bacterium]